MTKRTKKTRTPRKATVERQEREVEKMLQKIKTGKLKEIWTADGEVSFDSRHLLPLLTF